LTLFHIFKYITYATLAATGTYYTYYELIAVPYMYPEGVPLTEVFKAYPVTIDVWVWMIWLGVFELETWFIPEEKLKGALKWVLSSVRVSCYVLGLSALYGFFANLQIVYGFEPYSILDACSLSGSGFSLMVDIPEFEPVNSENCLALANAELYRLSGHDIIVDHETLVYSEQMAWSIVINGVAWWMVMAVLEGEYWLEQTERMTLGLSRIFDGMKGLIYSSFFATAVYWGYVSGWIDFVDSMAWIAAFVLIEMNILGVDSESEEISIESIPVTESGL
jgi:hypothetical protein